MGAKHVELELDLGFVYTPAFKRLRGVISPRRPPVDKPGSQVPCLLSRIFVYFRVFGVYPVTTDWIFGNEFR